jgi:hypothetical protein
VSRRRLLNQRSCAGSSGEAVDLGDDHADVSRIRSRGGRRASVGENRSLLWRRCAREGASQKWCNHRTRFGFWPREFENEWIPSIFASIWIWFGLIRCCVKGLSVNILPVSVYRFCVYS